MRCQPGVFAWVGELAANLETDNTAAVDELLEQRIGDVAWNVVDLAEPVMRGDDRTLAGVDDLCHGGVSGVRNVDDHAEPVHLAYDLAAVRCEAVPLRGGAAGIGVVLVPVVCGDLR